MPDENAKRPTPDSRRRQRRLKSLPRGVAAARVVELAPLAGARLHERERHVDRRHDRARRGVGLVANVDRCGCGIASVTFNTAIRSDTEMHGVMNSSFSFRSSLFQIPICVPLTFAPASVPRTCSKRLLQIRDQILRVFDPAGQADHVVGNARAACGRPGGIS